MKLSERGCGGLPPVGLVKQLLRLSELPIEPLTVLELLADRARFREDGSGVLPTALRSILAPAEARKIDESHPEEVRPEAIPAWLIRFDRNDIGRATSAECEPLGLHKATDNIRQYRHDK